MKMRLKVSDPFVIKCYEEYLKRRPNRSISMKSLRFLVKNTALRILKDADSETIARAAKATLDEGFVRVSASRRCGSTRRSTNRTLRSFTPGRRRPYSLASIPLSPRGHS